MRKKVLIISMSIIAGLTTAGLASGLLEEDSVSTSGGAVSTELAMTAADSVNTNLSANSKLRTADRFSSIMTCRADARYHTVTAYVAFMGENSFSPEQTEIINRILDKGTTIQSLAQVYDFWLTTDEPFGIIEEICALEDSYFSEYWYENAFNKLTNYEHGVLDSEGIDAYKEKGISVDEILTANTLCRRGVYTITEILDKVVDGEDIEDIACEIYGVETLPEAENSCQKVNLALKAKKYNIASSASASSAKATAAAIETAQTAYTDAVSAKIESEVSRLSLAKPEQTEDDFEAMQSTGLPISTLKALQNKGFTPAEIAKIPEMDTDDTFKAAKMAREVLMNE